MPRKARPRLGHGSPKKGPSHASHVGRPMIRYLLASYSTEQIQQLFEEEGCPLPLTPSLLSPPLENGDEDATLPEPEPEPESEPEPNSQIAPLDAADDGGPVVNEVTLPDDINVHLGEEMITTEQETSAPANENDKNAIGEISRSRRGEYPCGFCNEHGIKAVLSRKGDLGRHFERKHHTNKLWICPRRNCRAVFQWLGAFKEHVRSLHDSRIKISDAETIKLCPQTVFACGFEGCIKVYEAPSEFETGPTKEKFITHLLTHYRWDLKKPKVWSFTLRMRNLLRQDNLFDFWPPTWLSAEQRGRLSWDAHTSGVLQKLLETRHLGDANSLLQDVIALGLDPSKEVQIAQRNITLPIYDECRADIHQREMLAAEFAALPLEPVHINVQPINVDYGTLSVVPNYTDMANGSYQPQPLVYQDPTQQMLDSLITQPTGQQCFSTGYMNPMEWVDDDDDDDDDDEEEEADGYI